MAAPEALPRDRSKATSGRLASAAGAAEACVVDSPRLEYGAVSPVWVLVDGGEGGYP